MSETEFDPDSPPQENLPLVPTPEALNAQAAAGLSAADGNDVELVDETTDSAFDADRVDPTSEDLQDTDDLDDTEDRDYYPVKDSP